MRIWKGKEKELENCQEVEMLFIEGACVDINKILWAVGKTGIKILYFGAGKIEFYDFEKIKQLPDYLQIIIETPHPNRIPNYVCCEIVYTVEVSHPENITFIKLENNGTVKTQEVSEMFQTSLKNFSKNTMMYDTDELIWEDKQ